PMNFIPVCKGYSPHQCQLCRIVVSYDIGSARISVLQCINRDCKCRYSKDVSHGKNNLVKKEKKHFNNALKLYSAKAPITQTLRYFGKVNLAENPMAAGSKFISDIRFNSGFQSSEMFIGTLANL